MIKLKMSILPVSLIVTILVTMSGCSALKESLASQVEVPTLEKQVNRVAIGMDIVRENHVMAMKMKLSGDTTWPQEIACELNTAQEKVLQQILKRDPYYATIHYSEPIQRKMLGGSALSNQLNNAVGFNIGAIASTVSDPISPLTYRVLHKAQVLYGDNPYKWPDLFSFDGSIRNFLEFKAGDLKMVEAQNSDVYETLSQALIALTPTNFQKDLTLAKTDLDNAQDDVASLEGQKGTLKTKIERNDPISAMEKESINRQIDELEAQIKLAQEKADEKQKIYFTLLDSAVVEMKSDIKLNDEQIKLARNVNIVSKEIENGANEAYCTFGIVLANIGAQPILKHFPNELQSLAIASARFPQFANQFRVRIERLTKNAIYFLPNIGMGTYYAHQQSSLASKYGGITTIIVDAADAKAEADKNAAKTEKSQ